MNFKTEITIEKIVAQAGKPLQITAGIPDNAKLMEYVNARKGTAIVSTFSDIQGELGLEAGLEDLRLPEGSIFEIHTVPDIGEKMRDEDKDGDGGYFYGAMETVLRERDGYPYLVIGIEDGVPVVLDFPALISWIKEHREELLKDMASIPDPPAPENVQEEIPIDESVVPGSMTRDEILEAIAEHKRLCPLDLHVHCEEWIELDLMLSRFPDPAEQEASFGDEKPAGSSAEVVDMTTGEILPGKQGEGDGKDRV